MSVILGAPDLLNQSATHKSFHRLLFFCKISGRATGIAEDSETLANAVGDG